MPVPGAVVFAELREALEEFRTQGMEIQGRYAELDARIQELISERGHSLLNLAKHYLPDISHDSIGQTFEGIQGDLRSILDRRDRMQQELDGRLARLIAERDERESKLQEMTADLIEQTRLRDDLAKQVADRLAEQPGFRDKSTLALKEERELKENEERIAEINRDAAEKLPAYQQSRLFQYLYLRNYGTPKYLSKGFIRSCDHRVARLIEYPRAKQSYEFLQTTPRAMAAEVERRRKAFEELMDEVESMEQQAADAAGLTGQIRKVIDLEEHRKRLAASYDEFQENLRKVSGQRQELNESRGRFYEEALERFRQFLANTSVAVLEQQAARTIEQDDDEIVNRIELLNHQIEDLSPQSQKLADDRSEINERISAIEFAVRRFQQAGFESERSSFDESFHVQEQIDRLVKGVKDKDSLWESIRRAQKSEPTWLEQSVSGAGNAMNHPMTQMLLYSLIQVAGSALQGAANRAVDRRRKPRR